VSAEACLAGESSSAHLADLCLDVGMRGAMLLQCTRLREASAALLAFDGEMLYDDETHAQPPSARGGSTSWATQYRWVYHHHGTSTAHSPFNKGGIKRTSTVAPTRSIFHTSQENMLMWSLQSLRSSTAKYLPSGENSHPVKKRNR